MRSPSATILQTGSTTVRRSTAKGLNESTGLNLHQREWERGLEDLKRAFGLPSDHHGKTGNLGEYMDDAGNEIGNIMEYL